MLLISTFTYTLKKVEISSSFFQKCPYFESPYSINSIATLSFLFYVPISKKK